MEPGISSIRLRLAELIERAETDDVFRKHLESNRAEAFREYGIPEGAVEDFARQLQDAQRTSLGVDPTECVHTSGCSDFTCFSSVCGPTCYVTIPISQADA